MEQVYHTVTERPMESGQKIIFDQGHHNGVYNRVTTFKKIIDGEKIHGELADLIRSDMDNWGQVAYRELALEKVRAEEYPDYPSRMSCLYTSRTFEEARRWAEFFDRIGRKVFSVVKLSVDGNIFDADACNCFDGTGTAEDIFKARLYWQCAKTEKPVIETLVDGIITVEMVWEWDKIK